MYNKKKMKRRKKEEMEREKLTIVRYPNPKSPPRIFSR